MAGVSTGTLEAMAAAGLSATVAPWFYADWLQNTTVLDLPVPGQYIVRAINRTTPAEAVGTTLVDLALAGAERRVASGIHKREIRVGRVKDPGMPPQTEQKQLIRASAVP